MTERTFETKEISKALVNPAAVFGKPGEVVSAKGIVIADKIRILRIWEYDVREEEVAQEENMSGKLPVTLSQVLDALNALHAPVDHHSSPTKHGGR